MLRIDLDSLEYVTEFFYSFGGRQFHVSSMLLLAGSYGKISYEQAKFAEIIETAHCVDKLHNSVDDEDQLLSTDDLILGGDYMISNASIQCCKLERIELVQLLCKVIQGFAWTGVGRIHEEISVSDTLSHGCEGIALLAGEKKQLAQEIGMSLSSALSMVEDVNHFCQESMNIPNRLAEYAGVPHTEMNSFEAREEIIKSSSLARLRSEALQEIENALGMISLLPSNKYREGLVSLTSSLSEGLYS